MQIESDAEVIRNMAAVLERTIKAFKDGTFKWVDHEALDQEHDDGCRCAVQAIYDEIHPESSRTSSNVTNHVRTYLSLNLKHGDPLDCLAQWNDTVCKSQDELVARLEESRALLEVKEA